MPRDCANWDWTVKPNPLSGKYSWEQVYAAVLMDIRSELRRIREVLECPNTTRIPEHLRQIVANTKARKPLKRRTRKV